MCSRCKTPKPFEDFNRWARSKDGRQPYCRCCASSYYRANEDRHKAQTSARSKQYRREVAARLFDYLLGHPCVDCGEPDPVVLDFDHVRGDKVANVVTMAVQGYRWAVIEAEIEKCEVRCANCHRRKTARERGYYRHGALVKLGITPSF